MTSSICKRKEKTAQCTHMSMTRLHSLGSRCSICQRDGSTVFIYECTHDEEMYLQDLASRGELEFVQLFESLWGSFRGPFHVNDKGPLLVAKTENLHKPGPSTLNTNKVLNANNKTTTSTNDKENGEDIIKEITESREPYFSRFKQNQCHVKYCRNCFPCIEQRSYLELDAIINGKIPLTSLIAYPEYERPVSLATTVRNLGLRPSPNPNPKALVSQGDTTTAEDGHIAPPSDKTKEKKHDSAFNKSYCLNSSRITAPVLARSSPRLYFGPNSRRTQLASNEFVSTTALPSPIYVYNKTSVINYSPIITLPVTMRK